MPITRRIMHGVLHLLIARAAHNVLANRTLHFSTGGSQRWLRRDIAMFVSRVEMTVRELASGPFLPDGLGFGNLLMAVFSLYSVACFKELRASGLTVACAQEVTADLGWHVYRRMLGLYSLPIRMLSRNPATRLDWTIRMLMRFPFNTGEPNGYAVRKWKEDGNVHTHFTRCPPQSVARAVGEREGDDTILDAFYHSWCLYDWPGADLIAGDGKRSHYDRPRTLSRGDPVCDMCWIGYLDRRKGNRRRSPSNGTA